jgi:hypothetical protein
LNKNIAHLAGAKRSNANGIAAAELSGSIQEIGEQATRGLGMA